MKRDNGRYLGRVLAGAMWFAGVWIATPFWYVAFGSLADGYSFEPDAELIATGMLGTLIAGGAALIAFRSERWP